MLLAASIIAWQLLLVPSFKVRLHNPISPTAASSKILGRKSRAPSSLALQSNNGDNNDSNITGPQYDGDGSKAFLDIASSSRPFREALVELGLSDASLETILNQLVEAGLLSDRPQATPENLLLIAQDFVGRPEVFSALLISDFGLNALSAHQVRAGVMNLLSGHKQNGETQTTAATISSTSSSTSTQIQTTSNGTNRNMVASVNPYVPPNRLAKKDEGGSKEDDNVATKPVRRPNYKSVVVNQKAKQRRSQQASAASDSDNNNDNTPMVHDYGLPSDYKTRFPTISSELDEFYSFMTRPTTSSQDGPIRPATASVYMRHARQFLGWYTTTYNVTTTSGDISDNNDTTTSGDSSDNNNIDNKDDHDDDDTADKQLSLYKIFPSKEKKSADAVLNFVLWLRSSRNISVSYEANILRGLTKVLKFRFALESQSDPNYGEKSFDDIPLIREIRKLHRDANKRARLAPRSSDETQKWISWPEYLQVVQQTQNELVSLRNEYSTTSNKKVEKKKQQKQTGKVDTNATKFTPMERKIATLFQRYLILAIFSSVPDRQRTMRELEIGKNFQKDEAGGCWCIKHAPEDYKTGKAYGERPLLQLSDQLTPWIDEFGEEWRQCLVPLTQTLFVQPRTGKPLTQDSVYQLVSRACYQHTGKRTNPHLLRDMLVTHVRESNASEKQLEALALYMGHSIQMQRTSYDRRTLTKKVAPAVELMQSVNDQAVGGSIEENA